MQPLALGHLDNAFHVIGVLIYLHALTVVRPLRSESGLPPPQPEITVLAALRSFRIVGQPSVRIGHLAAPKMPLTATNSARKRAAVSASSDCGGADEKREDGKK